MVSAFTFTISPYFKPPCCSLRVQSFRGGDSGVLSSGSVSLNVVSTFSDKEKVASSIDRETERFEFRTKENKRLEVEDKESENLQALWDDGYGSQTVKDYFEISKEIIRNDGGPPRWFCPIECGRPIKDSPVLFFLPGLDGTGLGLVLHHKSLGKAFEVRCLHIPVYDRTPFEGLVKFVEKSVRLENASSPSKPIYLVGESFGGCLALAVAARNPTIDLVVILVNPATSFDRSQLQPLLPILEFLPDGLHATVPYLLSFIMGDPMKMAMVNIENGLPPGKALEKLSGNLTSLLPLLSGLADIIPKDTLLWKLKILKSASAYANSRLHAVKAEVLVLSSGEDAMLPSEDEAKRLMSLLQNCEVCHFKNSGHTLLLEGGISLLTAIKGKCKYRRSRRHDFISDFLPPSMSEFKYALDGVIGLFRLAASSVVFSTLENGKIVKGLAGVPNEGPILFVGNHMLMGLELLAIVEEFLREKNIMVHGAAHPAVFMNEIKEFTMQDWMKVFGAFPVAPKNLFKMLSKKSHVLLYPGGAREALHHKGEEYKLFWPEQPEFVRMAAHFGATIVPLASVGEDDIVELALDYNDMMRIPVLNDYIRQLNNGRVNLRENMTGEVAEQHLFIPGLLPKIPGRIYCLFGKPIQTKGRKELLKNKHEANALYLHIKAEVEGNLAYLLKKREEDPYRNFIDRAVYRAYASHQEIPTFEP